MWWNSQNLGVPREDHSGTTWHFRVWHAHVDGVYTQRIFFWDDAQSASGFVEYVGDRTKHISRLKQVISRLLKDTDFRSRHLRPLRFPIERHYADARPDDQAAR
jgi:hypothetical protein